MAFDRFLARMFSKGPKATYPWVLKGGYAMELRMHSARTTKDIDLTLHDGTRLSKDPRERGEQVRAMLQEAAATRFDDYFEFLVGEAREDLDGAPEGGSRYPVQARMDGRDFARFHVDVGVALLPVMADRTFVILKYTDKVPSMASCTKCQRKFLVPSSLGGDPESRLRARARRISVLTSLTSAVQDRIAYGKTGSLGHVSPDRL